jgi:hypothetical protein
MVKVLQIDLFEKGGILPLTSEPIAVTATSDFVLVAFANGIITRYDASEGTVRLRPPHLPPLALLPLAPSISSPGPVCSWISSLCQ